MATEVAGLEVQIDGSKAEASSKRLEGSFDRLANKADATQGAFNRLSNAASAVGNAFLQMVRQINTAERAFAVYEVALGGVRNGMRGLVLSLPQAAGAFREVQTETSRTQQALTNFQRIAAAVGVTLGVREVLAYTDAYKSLNAQIRLVSESGSVAQATFNELLAAANQTGQSIGGLVSLYAGLERATEGASISTRTLLDVTDSVSRLLASAQVSGEGAQAALFQFSQAMAAGALRGDEFNSVMEQTPPLAQAIARGLGVAIGRLREMAEAGELTADQVLNALQKQRDAILELQIAETLSGQLTALDNTLTAFIGRADEAAGASAVLRDQIGGFIDRLERPEALNGAVAVMDRLAIAARLLGGAFLFLVDHIDAVIAAFVIFQGAKGLIGAAIAFGTATNAALLFSKSMALVGVNVGIAAKSFAGLGAAFAFANPLGAVVSLLTAGAAAFLLWKSNATSAQEAQTSYQESLSIFGNTVEDVTAKLDKMSEAQRRVTEANLVQAIEQQRAAFEDAARGIEAVLRNVQQQNFKEQGIGGFAGLQEQVAAFRELQQAMDDVAAGRRTLDDVVESFTQNAKVAESYRQALDQLQAEADAASQSQERLGLLMKIVAGTATEAEKAAYGLRGAVETAGTAAAKAAEDWKKFIDRLHQARDTFAANTQQEAEYAARAAGFSDQRIAVASAVGAQIDALKRYQDALREGQVTEASALEQSIRKMAEVEAAAARAYAIAEATAKLAPLLTQGILTQIEALRFVTSSGEQAYQRTLGEAQTRLGQSLSNIRAVTEPSKAASAASKATDQLREFVQETEAAIRATEALVTAHGQSEEAIRKATIAQKIEQDVLKLGEKARTRIIDLRNREVDAVDRLDLAKTTFELRREAQELTDHGRAVLAGVDALRQYNIEKEISEALAGKNAAAIGAETEALRKAAQERARAQQFQAATGDVESLIRETATPLEQYKARLQELDRLETDLRQGGGPISREAEQALQRARVEAEGIVDATNPMAQVFEDAASRIHGAFTGLFEGLFSDGLDSFKDLGKSILSFFKQTLAQMAALALARPILVPIVSGLGGLFGVSAATQAGVLGQIGGASGATGTAGGGFSGLNPLAFFGGNSIGLGASNVVGGLQNLAFKAGFQGAGNALGGFAGNLSGVSNLSLGGGGFVGGTIGNLGANAVFGNRGTGANIGGAVGGTIGAIAGTAIPIPFVGPAIGSAIGSFLGNFVGGLFGGDETPRAALTTTSRPLELEAYDQGIENISARSPFGYIGFRGSDTRDIKAKEFDEAFEALAQLDTALTQSLLPEQIDAITRALDGWVSSTQRGTITIEEMARQRLDVVVAALGDEFSSLGARLRGLPIEEAYALIEAFSSLRNAIPALDQQIASLTRSGLDAFGDQIQALEDNVTAAVQRLRDALRTGDLVQAAQLLATAQAAVLERYQTEVQLVQDLAAQVQEISRAGEDFALSLTERIARLQPPGIDLEAAYSQRGVELYNAIVETQDPARQFALLQEFTDAYDRWFESATARIDAATEDGIRNFERYKSAVQDAAAVRLEGLQQELEIAEQWTGVLQSAQGLIDRLRLSSSNPLPTGARLTLAQGDVSAARTRLATATGAERQGAAQELLDALERQLELGQEIYARPSREYLNLYNQTVAEIAAIQNAARAEGRSAEAIQDKIARINEGTAATVAGIDAQIAQWRARQEADQAALRAQALQGYQTIREFGTGLSAVMEGQARQQLNVLTAGLSVSEFIAQQQSRAVTILTEIRDNISRALTGSFAVGTDYVPKTGLALIHQGERILTAGENQTFGPAVDRMLAQGAVPHFQSGGYVPRETLAVLHAGETVVPAGGGDINVTVPVTVNVTGNGGDPVRLADEVIRRVRRELPEAIVQAAPLLKKRLRTA